MWRATTDFVPEAKPDVVNFEVDVQLPPLASGAPFTGTFSWAVVHGDVHVGLADCNTDCETLEKLFSFPFCSGGLGLAKQPTSKITAPEEPKINDSICFDDTMPRIVSGHRRRVHPGSRVHARCRCTRTDAAAPPRCVRAAAHLQPSW